MTQEKKRAYEERNEEVKKLRDKVHDQVNKTSNPQLLKDVLQVWVKYKLLYGID